MADEQEDLEHISKFVMRLLQSPTWVTPIANFIDQNCSIFEDVEENKLEYTRIHNEFRTLIDGLLAGHLEELSVTTEQFTRFCEHGLTGNNELYRNIAEELISVDDFLVFKAMMVKRSADIHREALGRARKSFEDSDDGVLETFQPAAMCESFEDAEELEAERRCVEAQLNIAHALSLQLEKRVQLMEELNRYLDLLAKVHRLQADLLAAEVEAEQTLAAERALEQEKQEAKKQEPEQAMPPLVRVRPLHEVPPGAAAAAAPAGGPMNTSLLEQKRAEAAFQRDRAQRAMAANPAPPQGAPPQPTEEERRARAEHLKRQRELLVEKKNRERAKELSAYRQVHGPTPAARAAEKACQRVQNPASDGRQLAAELSGQAAPPPQNPLPDPDAAAKEMRQMITRQLKHTLTQSFRPGA